MRRSTALHVLGTILLASGLFLAVPGAWAQMHQSQSAGPRPVGVSDQPGLQSTASGQNGLESSFVATMRRNSEVETDLSKMALKNSGDDGVKKFASQVIRENRKDEMALVGASRNTDPSDTTPTFVASVPSQTRNAEKQMKKLSGAQFDEMYLSQLNAYVNSDRQMLGKYSAALSSPGLQLAAMRMRNTADQRKQQIAQVAQSENFTIQ